MNTSSFKGMSTRAVEGFKKGQPVGVLYDCLAAPQGVVAL